MKRAVILLPAVAFSVMHFQYAAVGMLVIFMDGVLYGVARHHTRTLFVPVLLHMLGNAYAVYERIAA